MYALLTAMRTAARSLEIAELAVRYRDEGVVGFDIAGAEAGWPPSRHLDAFQYLKREDFHITIHAGEAFGLPSIWEAVQWCGTERLGHGVRIVDDIEISPEGTVRLGRLAAYIRDRRIPLEMCPTSNVQTGAARSIAEHPIRILRQLQFRVTVNTDNRLMSQVTLSSEFHRLADGVRLRLVGRRMADHQRDEERVRRFRRAAAPDQHGHQAGLRHRPRAQRCGGSGQPARTPSHRVNSFLPNGPWCLFPATRNSPSRGVAFTNCDSALWKLTAGSERVGVRRDMTEPQSGVKDGREPLRRWDPERIGPYLVIGRLGPARWARCTWAARPPGGWSR